MARLWFLGLPLLLIQPIAAHPDSFFGPCEEEVVDAVLSEESCGETIYESPQTFAEELEDLGIDQEMLEPKQNSSGPFPRAAQPRAEELLQAMQDMDVARACLLVQQIAGDQAQLLQIQQELFAYFPSPTLLQQVEQQVLTDPRCQSTPARDTLLRILRGRIPGE